MESLNKKIRWATKWAFASELVAKIIVPLNNAILAHLLMPEDFGIIATINMIIAFTDILTEAGFGQYLIQHNYKDEEEYGISVDVAFWTHLGIAGIIWCIIGIFRKQVASAIGIPAYSLPLAVACASIPLTAFVSVPTAVLQKNFDFKSLFYNRILGSLTPLFVSVPMALLGFQYWSIIGGVLAGNIVKGIVLISRSGWHPRFRYNLKALQQMYTYCIWILLEGIMMWACTWLDVLIISKAFGSYYTGLYKTAQTTVTGILSVITASVNSILFTALAKLKYDMDDFRGTLYSMQKKLAILVVPLGAGIWLYSDLITEILLGTQWMEGCAFLGMWGICMAMVATMGTFCREALRAKGMAKESFSAQTFHFIFVIAVMLVSVPMGYNVLIYTRSLAYLQVILVLFYFCRKRLAIQPSVILKNTLWPAVCSIIMVIFGFYIKQVLGSGIVMGLLGVALCIIAYFSVFLLSKEYRGILKNMILQKTK